MESGGLPVSVNGGMIALFMIADSFEAFQCGFACVRACVCVWLICTVRG